MYGIIGIYGFSAYPDEFGYWSPAAAILGYDWSGITGLGSYYSYGYSILLVPILALFDGAVSSYRAAVVLNLLLQCISFVLVFKILEVLYPKESRDSRSIVTAMAVLYPAWIFYIQTTMAEGLLYFSLLLSVYIMLRFLKHPCVINGILMGVMLIFVYLVHMRCIGTIGAGVVTILIWALSGRTHTGKKTHKALLIIPLVIALFAVSFVLKDLVIDRLYKDTSDFVLSWNDYSSLMIRLRKFFDPEGLGYLFKDICGKVLYMGLATYGIAYFGIAGCVRHAALAFRRIRKRESSFPDFLWIYILLIAIFQFGVALVYLNGASAPDVDRMDNFLHGRYIDFFLPLLVMVGLEEMLHGKRLFIRFEVTYALYLVLVLIAMSTILNNNFQLRNAHGFTMIGMSYMLERPLPDPPGYFMKEVLLSVALTLLVHIVVIIARTIKRPMVAALLLIIQVALGLHACNMFIFPYQDYIFGDIMIGEKLKEALKQYPDKEVLHIYEGGVQYIELVQLECKDAKIEVVNLEEDDNTDITQYLDKDKILIIPEAQEYEETVDEFYEEKWDIAHLILYYNPE